MKTTPAWLSFTTRRERPLCRIALFQVLLIGLFSAICNAQVTSVRLIEVDNSSGAPEVHGFVTTDVVIDFDGTYSGSQLYIQLDQGSIYQDAVGGNTAPPEALIDLHPSVAFDSFVTSGAPVLEDSFGTDFLAGAVNLFGSDSLIFDTTQASVAWFPSTGQTITDQTDFLTTRLTLSEDAQGTWRYLASAEFAFTAIGSPDEVDGDPLGGFTFLGPGVIRNGRLVVVPEPSTLVHALLLFAGLGGGAWCRMRRRSRSSA